MYIPARGNGGFSSTRVGDHGLGGPAAHRFTRQVNSDIENGRIKKNAPRAQLYHLRNDPNQKRNIIRQHAETVATLQAVDVPCSPVRSAAEAIAWPQLAARGMVDDLRDADGGPTGTVAGGLPIKFSRTPVGHTRPAPHPGAHTDRLLAEVLDLDESSAAALREAGVI